MFGSNKYVRLLICLLMDGVGMLSYILPGIGEAMDIVWAPVATYIMYKMFGDRLEGKIGSFLTLIEELSIGLDFIPTFTITWIFRYLVKNGSNDN